MDRSKLADVSQIVSSVVIVITLIYLTVEVRQNTNALYAQSRETVLSISQTSLLAQMENPEIVATFVKDGPLTAEENIRLNAYLISILRGREFAWLQYRDGIIDDDQWRTELAVLETVLRPHRNRDWWESLGRPVFSANFSGFVDAHIQDDPPTDEFYERIVNWNNCVGCSGGSE